MMRIRFTERARVAGRVGHGRHTCRRGASRSILLACLLLSALPSAGRAQDPSPAMEYYFYRSHDYGSDALIHPLRLIIAGGYGITQLDNRDNRIWSVDYRNGWNNLMMNLGNPIEAIEREGWRNFFFRQVAPFSTNRASAQYYPNYTQHLIGGGMSYRLMLEWFRYHCYPRPTLLAVGTIAAYHLLNEVVENDGFVGYSTDPIADLYLFDPLSMVLFSSDRVARFFGETLQMSDWSYQAGYDPWRGTIENNGQNFALKFPLPRSERWRFFYHYGTHGEGGLSYTRPKGDCISVAAGFKAQNLIELTQGNRTVDLALVAGIFYDRNGSLLASLLYAETKDYRLRLNLYPGLVRIGPISPGFFLALDRDGRMLLGINLLQQPFGLAGGGN